MKDALMRTGGAVVAGLVLVLAFPPYDLWFLAVLGPSAMILLARGASLKRSAGYGFVFGMAFFLPLMYWTGLEVGPIPVVLLALLQSAFFVPLAMGFTVLSRVPGWPVWTAALWVAVEAFRGRVPWGGLTWGKLAFAQADGPFTGLASLGGTPLVSFAVALAGTFLAWIVVRRDLRVRLAASAAATAVTLVGLLVPLAAANGDTITVASVQGNVPAMGLDFNDRAREITGNHAESTHRLADQVESGDVDQPDLVIWPENSSDISPFDDQRTYEAIDRAVRDINVPVMVSAIVPTEDAHNVRNTSILWDPQTGPGATYVKRHPMPFGEYIPFRNIAALITDAVNEQPRDQLPGDEAGLFQTDEASVGVVICFEAGFDGIVRDAVRAGGQLITVQTNNATFRDSPMSEQHLAMSRIRAVEHARPVVVSALSGISAIIGPDGEVQQRLELFTQDTMVAEIQLSDATTLATTVGVWPEWVLVGMALGAVAAGVVAARRQSSVAETEPEEEPATVPAGV